MNLENLIYNKISSLSPGQRKVAEYILHNKEIFSYATLAKLSKDISVSETTVIRLAYSLGFDSFSEMQQKIRSEILSEPLNKNSVESDMDSFYKTAFSKEVQLLQNWISHLDEHLLDQFIEGLINADRILVVGARSSFSTASWVGARLNLLLGNTFTIREFYDSRFDLLNDVTEHTVVLSIAFARYTKWTYKYAESAKAQGAQIFSITDSISSPLFDLSDCTILAAPAKDSMGFSSLICVYSLFDVITSKIHSERQDEITERLNKYESTYRDFDMFYE